MTRIVRSDSRAHGWRQRARKWTADRLIAAAKWLDPGRPEVRRMPDGSHTVSLGGMDLAKIGPGMIADQKGPYR